MRSTLRCERTSFANGASATCMDAPESERSYRGFADAVAVRMRCISVADVCEVHGERCTIAIPFRHVMARLLPRGADLFCESRKLRPLCRDTQRRTVRAAITRLNEERDHAGKRDSLEEVVALDERIHARCIRTAEDFAREAITPRNERAAAVVTEKAEAHPPCGE